MKRPAALLVATALCSAASAGAASAAERLVVGTKSAPPFAIAHADGSWSGISIELWRRVASELGLEFELVERDLPDLFAGLQDGSLDVAVAALTVTAEREELVDFSHPFFRTGLGIAARSERRGTLDALRGLLSLELLGLVGAFLLLVVGAGALVWVFERRRNPEQFPPRPLEGLGAATWWSAVTMTTVGYGDMAPRSPAGRAAAVVWMLASVVIVSSFIATLSSAITVDRLRTSVEGAGDLTRVEVGAVAGSTSVVYLDERGLRYRSYASGEEALAALSDGRVEAVVYDAPLLQYLIATHDVAGVRVLPETFQRQSYAIALASASPLREEVNRALLRVTSSEDWLDTLDRYLER